MHSSRLYSCYFFIFTSSILISIPPSFCAGNEHYANENKPSQFLNIQAQHPLLRFRVLLPQYEVRSSRLLCENNATRCTEAKSSATCKSGSCSASSSARVIDSTVVPAKSPPASISPPSIAPPPKIADPPTPNSPPPSTPRLPNIAKTPIPSSTPKPEPSSKGKLLMAIAIASAILGIVVISFVIIYTVKRGHLSRNKIVCWERGTRNYPFNEEEMMKNFETMVPKRYAYLEVKKLTNSFKNKLGQGGYGTVYKGKLPDGRLVAVKVLSESKGDGEEFINEVISISRTSHVNIVTLVGFCYERNKRALIYEFMPNGSLDQFIYNKRSSHTTSHLDKKTMFRIAIGIARGLEYLHIGCRTKILHFDIKPHNILLDEDLCPKISDFGLAKLCKRKESIVSMMDMRGTIGYIAPEVFSRNFGIVSHKSDVYSYGMLILEMIGGRKNFDGEISRSSERDFSHWIYAKLEKGKILNTFEEGIEEEEEEDLGKKMIVVGLWCIQTNPSDRPSIGKVIEMLEGPFNPYNFLQSLSCFHLLDHLKVLLQLHDHRSETSE